MKKLLFFGYLILFLLNCKVNDDVNAIDCTEVACTNIFIALFVSVNGPSNTAVSLDAFQVTDKETAEDVTLPLSESELQLAQEYGEYPLYNDSFISGNQNTTKTLVFKGFINNEMVVEAQYEVGIDCCHVSIVSGDTDITIN